MTEYSFRLLTNGAVLKDNLLYYDGKETARLGEIMIFDSDGQADLGYIKSETVKEGEEYLVTVCVSDKFMKDAVYPVYIDPTITTSGSGEDKTIQDAPVYSNNNNANGGNAYNFCGYLGSTNGLGKVLVKLPGLLNDEIFDQITYHQINSVILYFREASGYTDSASITARPFLEDWSEYAVTNNNVDLTNREMDDAYAVNMSYNGSPNWWSYNITTIAKAWKTGTFNSAYGLIFENTIPTSTSYLRNFLATEYSSSSYRPYITFTYTPAITLSSYSYDLNVGNSGIPIYVTTKEFRYIQKSLLTFSLMNSN